MKLRPIAVIVCLMTWGLIYFASFTLPPSVTSQEFMTPTPYIVSFGEDHYSDIVFVPKGEFTMGLDKETGIQECEKYDLPENCQHVNYAPQFAVEVNSFWIDRFEVTNAQYERCVLFGACLPRPEFPSHMERYQLTGDNQPVVGITWYDAARYCDTRFARLPTEIEWEYAARGPESYLYPWGNTFDANLITSEETTLPVDANPDGASWIGAYNMVGNVAEWTESRLYPYPLTELPPDGWAFDYQRIFRGGSFGGFKTELNSYYRGGTPHPEELLYHVGFRCVKSALHLQGGETIPSK